MSRLNPVKRLYISLLVQIFAGANAGIMFSQLDNKLLAGILASTGFFIMATTNYFLYINAPKKPLSFWANLGFLVLAVGPLAYERFTDWTSSKLPAVLGFDPDIFHKFSESLFMVVLVALVFDLAIHFLNKKKSA